MKHIQPKKELGKWQVVLFTGYSPKYNDPFVRQLVFGVIKFHTLPEDGVLLTKRYYNGFIINLIYKFPIAKG